MKNHSGFSTKEFLMVIVVITILCLAAIPPFFALQSSRHKTEMQTVVQVVQTQLQNLKNTGAAFPTALDANPVQSPCLNCFSGIGKDALNNPLWYKFTATTYLFSTNGNHNVVTDYQESGDYKIEYDSGNGTLKIAEMK